MVCGFWIAMFRDSVVCVSAISCGWESSSTSPDRRRTTTLRQCVIIYLSMAAAASANFICMANGWHAAPRAHAFCLVWKETDTVQCNYPISVRSMVAFGVAAKGQSSQGPGGHSYSQRGRSRATGHGMDRWTMRPHRASQYRTPALAEGRGAAP